MANKRSSTSTVIELSRYVYQTLRADEEFALSRARRDGEQSTVLVVAPVSEDPARGSLARLEHESSLRDELDPDWALRPLALTRREGRTMLVLDDPGGEPLDQFLGKPMELGRFLRLAINLAGEIHDSLAQNFAGISIQLLVAPEAIQMKSNDAFSHVERPTDLARIGLPEPPRPAIR